MSVFDLKVGDSAIIIKITAQGAEADRLSAVGLTCGERVTALAFSLFNSGILLGVGASRVALRAAAAKKIEVQA